MLAFLCIFGNIHFFLTRSGLNHVYSFMSCSFHSALYKKLFHISDHSFWKLFSGCTGLQLVHRERENGSVSWTSLGRGPWPLWSHSSVLGAEGAQYPQLIAWNGRFCSHHSLATGPLEPWPLELSIGAFCHFLMSQHMCCLKYTEHLFVFSNIQIIYFD